MFLAPEDEDEVANVEHISISEEVNGFEWEF